MVGGAKVARLRGQYAEHNWKYSVPVIQSAHGHGYDMSWTERLMPYDVMHEYDMDRPRCDACRVWGHASKLFPPPFAV